jgi:hypothetical protein
MELSKWINSNYLTPEGVADVRESVKAKPTIKYCVLDSFFLPERLDAIIAHHATLKFNEAADRTGHDMVILPYDGAVKWADGNDVGAEFYFAEEVKEYFCYLLNRLKPPGASVELKLRWHKPHATGFWIHSDSVWRSIVAIMYFNKNWKASDGGLLQLWRPDEASYDKSMTFDNIRSDQRLDFLNENQRLKTNTPGGGWPSHWPHQSRDMILVDQIVPAYNRLFLCDLDADPTFHSVTPSCDKIRTGFVYWLTNQSHPNFKGNDHGS